MALIFGDAALKLSRDLVWLSKRLLGVAGLLELGPCLVCFECRLVAHRSCVDWIVQ